MLIGPTVKACVDFIALLSLMLWLPPSAVEATRQARQPVSQTSAIDAIRTALVKGITLLEKGELEAFLKELYTPDQFKRLTQRHTASQAAEAMKKNGDFARTLSAFRAATNVEPKLVKDDTMAIFEFTTPVDTLKRIAFVRIGTRWYLF